MAEGAEAPGETLFPNAYLFGAGAPGKAALVPGSSL